MNRAALSPALRALLDAADQWVDASMSLHAARDVGDEVVSPGTVAVLDDQHRRAMIAYHHATIAWWRDEHPESHGERRRP